MINFAYPYLYQPSSSSQISIIVLSKDQQFFHINLDHKLSHRYVSLFYNFIILLHKVEREVLHFKGYILNFVISQLYPQHCTFLASLVAFGELWGGGKVATWWRPLAMAGGGTVKIFKKCAPNGWFIKFYTLPTSPPHSHFYKCALNDWFQHPS